MRKFTKWVISSESYCTIPLLLQYLSYLYLGKSRIEGTRSTMNSHGRSFRATFTLDRQSLFFWGQRTNDKLYDINNNKNKVFYQQ